MKRKSKPPMKRADQLFSRFIRLRDGQCVVCAAVDGLQCAHLISRRYKAVRHDPDNAVALCLRCHMRYTHKPLEWDQWCEDRLGADGWANLRRKALAGGKTDYKALLAWLNEAVREQEAS